MPSELRVLPPTLELPDASASTEETLNAMKRNVVRLLEFVRRLVALLEVIGPPNAEQVLSHLREIEPDDFDDIIAEHRLTPVTNLDTRRTDGEA